MPKKKGTKCTFLMRGENPFKLCLNSSIHLLALKKLPYWKLFIFYWGERGESNPRISEPQTEALTTWRRSPPNTFIIKLSMRCCLWLHFSEPNSDLALPLGHITTQFFLLNYLPRNKFNDFSKKSLIFCLGLLT